MIFADWWVMPRRVVDLLFCWKGEFGGRQFIDVWEAIPLCIIWIIWKEQNMWTFEGTERSLPELKLNFRE